MLDVLDRPVRWFKRLIGRADPTDEYDVDGCFTLPGARLDDLQAVDDAQFDDAQFDDGV